MAQSVQGLIAVFEEKKKCRAEYWFLMQLFFVTCEQLFKGLSQLSLKI